MKISRVTVTLETEDGHKTEKRELVLDKVFIPPGQVMNALEDFVNGLEEVNQLHCRLMVRSKRMSNPVCSVDLFPMLNRILQAKSEGK